MELILQIITLIFLPVGSFYLGYLWRGRSKRTLHQDIQTLVARSDKGVHYSRIVGSFISEAGKAEIDTELTALIQAGILVRDGQVFHLPDYTV